MATLRILTKHLLQIQKVAFVGLLILLNLSLRSQTSNSDFERIKIIDEDTEFSGIAIAPDNKTIAITSKGSAPVRIIDWNTKKITREINASNWMTGSTVSFSNGGKYLVLQEIGFSDFSQNRNRSIDYEIIDLASGNRVKKFDKVQDVVISADEKTAFSLNNNEVTFWNLPSGEKGKSISIAGAGNAIALSQDGKLLAVSQIINEADYKNQFKKDKKGLKNVVKFKQVVSLFNPESGEKIKTINEFYDLIYNLAFLPGENILFVYQTPDIRIQINNKNLSYVNLVDIAKMEPMRKGFTSMSMTQPELKISSDHVHFAINSKGNRFQEMHLYNYESGELEKRFELAHRLFEKVDGEKMINGSRPTFIFLPDNQSILIAMGNQLIKWNTEIDQ